MELIKCETFRAKISPETCRVRKQKAVTIDHHDNVAGLSTASFAQCLNCDPEGMRRTKIEGVEMNRKDKTGLKCSVCHMPAKDDKRFNIKHGKCGGCYDRARREKITSIPLAVGSSPVFAPHIEQGLKYDGDKLRYDLVPPEALEEIVKILTFGAQKYTDRNWEKGINYGRVYGALMRHLQAFWRGEDVDPESGLSHLSHAGCCLFFLLTYDRRGMVEFDDRPIMASPAPLYKVKPNNDHHEEQG